MFYFICTLRIEIDAIPIFISNCSLYKVNLFHFGNDCHTWRWYPHEMHFFTSRSQRAQRGTKAVQKIQRKLLSLQARVRLVHHLQSNNCRQITPTLSPNREWCKILHHSSLLIRPPACSLPLQDLQRPKKPCTFSSKRDMDPWLFTSAPHLNTLVRHWRCTRDSLELITDPCDYGAGMLAVYANQALLPTLITVFIIIYTDWSQSRLS